MKKSRLKVLSLVFILSVFSLVTYFYVMYKNGSGFCVLENRTLSQNELLNRAKANFLGVYYDFAQEWDGAWQVGIIPPYSTEDFEEIFRNSYNNEKSFLDNFSIKVISPKLLTEDEYLSFKLEDGFSFVLFAVGGEWNPVEFFLVNDISKESIINNEWEEGVGFHNRFLGFGNFYYRIDSFRTDTFCCDNDRHSNAEEDYLSIKRSAHLEVIKRINNGQYLHGRVFAVSNCGAVMTTSRNVNGSWMKVIKWFKE